MIITKRFKNLVKKLGKEGYTHIASTVAQHYQTKYYQFFTVSEILGSEVGIDLYIENARGRGETDHHFSKENPTAKPITYQKVFW